MSACKKCGESMCLGKCENRLLDMLCTLGDDMTAVDKELMRVNKLNYVLTSKVNAIFGTGIEIVNDNVAPNYDADGNPVDNEQTKEFEKILYNINENGNSNFSELKRAIREREIFGESYLFFDDVDKGFYFLRKNQVTAHKYNTEDSIIKKVAFYTIGTPELPDNGVLKWGKSGYVRQTDEDGKVKGYIIHPDNLVRFYSDTFVLNSDLDQLQLLMSINEKFIETSRLRDFGDVYAFTEFPKERMSSANSDSKIKNATEAVLKSMNDKLVGYMKKGKVEDSSAIVLDKRVRDVKQLEPVIKPTDYQFVWENQDDIISSVANWPKILANLGNDAGNVGKQALIKDARANFLTPTKNDVANSMSVIARNLFGEGSYVRFKDYEEIDI